MFNKVFVNPASYRKGATKFASIVFKSRTFLSSSITNRKARLSALVRVNSATLLGLPIQQYRHILNERCTSGIKYFFLVEVNKIIY